MKKIAIIGGGSAGLCTARHLLDPKYCSIFEPVIFEQKDCIGGTWVYEDYDINQPKKEVHSSVYQNLRLVLVFYPASMYLFKVKNGNAKIICEILQRHYNDFNNGKTRTISKMYSKLAVKTPERGQIRCSGVFIVNFKQISHIALVLPLLNLNKTNLPKQVMCYPDFPFPEDSPTYLHHTLVCKYLENYAKHFDLEKAIRFKCEVKSISPILPESSILNKENRFVRWQLRYTKLDTEEDCHDEFDGVVLCNGHFSKPNYPDINGLQHFKGTFLHSHYYRRPQDFKGKSVLILGNGPSGIDILVELSEYCSLVYLAHKGDKVTSRLPTNVVELPLIDRVNESGEFVFENGFKTLVDVFMPCTGYLYDFPFLTAECELHLKDGGRIVTPLYKHFIHTKYPSLVTPGLVWQCIPLPLLHQQCGFIASLFSGKVCLPSEDEMNVSIDNEIKQLLNEGKPLRHFHRFRERQWKYNKDLAMITGLCENPLVIEKLYKFSIEIRRENLFQYKDTEYRQIDAENFVQLS